MITDPAEGIRIGDAERETAVGRLGEHLREGRLTPAEYDERAAAAFAARTENDLRPLFGDLPGGAPGRTPVPGPRPAARRGPVSALDSAAPVLLVVVAVLAVAGGIAFAAVTHHPPLFLFALVWIAFALRRRHWRRAQMHGWPGPYRRW